MRPVSSRSSCLAAAGMLLLVPAAHAGLTTTASGSASVHIASGASPGSVSTKTVGPTGVEVASFDSDLGVLTGVTLQASASGSAAWSRSTGVSSVGVRSRRSVGFGSRVSSFAASGTLASGSTSTTASYSSGEVVSLTSVINSFIDKTVFLQFSGEMRAENNFGTSSVFDVSSELVNATLSYSHVAHANGSFSAGGDQNSLTLDLSAGSRNLSFFALGSAGSTARLELVRSSCSGNCAAFALTGLSAGFSGGLQAGGTAVTSAALQANTPGSYRATWEFEFIDNVNGVGRNLSFRTNKMTLDLTARVSAVPEPSSGSLALLGCGLLAGVRRLRRRAD